MSVLPLLSDLRFNFMAFRDDPSQFGQSRSFSSALCTQARETWYSAFELYLATHGNIGTHRDQKCLFEMKVGTRERWLKQCGMFTSCLYLSFNVLPREPTYSPHFHLVIAQKSPLMKWLKSSCHSQLNHVGKKATASQSINKYLNKFVSNNF